VNSDFNKIWSLLQLDLKVEYRNRYDLLGLLFFVIVISYVLSRAFQSVESYVYNQVYWVFVLIISVNFALRSFGKTREEESAFLYQLVSPEHVITSKLLLNATLIFFGSLVLLLSGLLFNSFESSFQSFPLLSFIGLLAVVSICLSSTFSLPSALVMTTSNRGTMLGLLSFPVSIPAILLTINIGGSLIANEGWNKNGLLLLLSIILIMSVVSLYLFRYIWKG